MNARSRLRTAAGNIGRTLVECLYPRRRRTGGYEIRCRGACTNCGRITCVGGRPCGASWCRRPGANALGGPPAVSPLWPETVPDTCSGVETVPNRCTCTCEGCRHHCGAHQPAVEMRHRADGVNADAKNVSRAVGVVDRQQSEG